MHNIREHIINKAGSPHYNAITPIFGTPIEPPPKTAVKYERKMINNILSALQFMKFNPLKEL